MKYICVKANTCYNDIKNSNLILLIIKGKLKVSNFKKENLLNNSVYKKNYINTILNNEDIFGEYKLREILYDEHIELKAMNEDVHGLLIKEEKYYSIFSNYITNKQFYSISLLKKSSIYFSKLDNYKQSTIIKLFNPKLFHFNEFVYTNNTIAVKLYFVLEGSFCLIDEKSNFEYIFKENGCFSGLESLKAFFKKINNKNNINTKESNNKLKSNIKIDVINNNLKDNKNESTNFKTNYEFMNYENSLVCKSKRGCLLELDFNKLKIIDNTLIEFSYSLFNYYNIDTMFKEDKFNKLKKIKNFRNRLIDNNDKSIEKIINKVASVNNHNNCLFKSKTTMRKLINNKDTFVNYNIKTFKDIKPSKIYNYKRNMSYNLINMSHINTNNIKEISYIESNKVMELNIPKPSFNLNIDSISTIGDSKLNNNTFKSIDNKENNCLIYNKIENKSCIESDNYSKCKFKKKLYFNKAYKNNFSNKKLLLFKSIIRNKSLKLDEFDYDHEQTIRFNSTSRNLTNKNYNSGKFLLPFVSFNEKNY